MTRRYMHISIIYMHKQHTSTIFPNSAPVQPLTSSKILREHFSER